MTGGQSQAWRVLADAFRPMVSEEAFASMDDAPDAIRDEYNDWADEEDKK